MMVKESFSRSIPSLTRGRIMTGSCMEAFEVGVDRPTYSVDHPASFPVSGQIKWNTPEQAETVPTSFILV